MKNFVKTKDVEKQVFDWGKLEWLSEPNTTGSENMVTGVVSLKPGQGHSRHNHPGIEENLYILKGKGKQTIEINEELIEKEVTEGELIHIPADIFHSTINIGEDDLEILAIYQFSGPEKEMKADPNCKIIPAEPN